MSLHEIQYQLQHYSPDDPGIHRALLESSYDLVFQLAFALLGDKERSKAVTRKTLLTAIRQLPGLQPGRDLLAWIVKIGLRESRHSRRYKFSRSASTFPQQLIHGELDNQTNRTPPVDPMDSVLMRAIQSLGERQRLLLTLHFGLKLPSSSLAQALGIREDRAAAETQQAIRNLESRIRPANRGQFIVWQLRLSTLWRAPNLDPVIRHAAIEQILVESRRRPRWGPGLRRILEVLWVSIVVAAILGAGWVFDRAASGLNRSGPERETGHPDQLTVYLRPDVPLLVVPERAALSWPGSREHSSDPQISARGRYIVFTSSASNLVPRDTNQAEDAFLYDRLSGKIMRMSIGWDGRQGNAASLSPSLSDHGRYVAFTSYADNLVTGDTQTCDIGGIIRNCPDVFVHDWLSSRTEMISRTDDGKQADAASFSAVISGDGLWVAFWSAAGNLVSGGSPCQGSSQPLCLDLYLHHRLTKTNIRIPVGRPLLDLDIGRSRMGDVSVSYDGRWLILLVRSDDALAQDVNLIHPQDLYVYDRVSGQLTAINTTESGQPGNAPSYAASISLDGRWIAFASAASNLVRGDQNQRVDVFVRDTFQGTVRRVSVSHLGEESNGDSGVADASRIWYQDALSISEDGSLVLFSSSADNLVPDQRTLCSNFRPACHSIYLYDMVATEIEQVSIVPIGLFLFASMTEDEQWTAFNAEVESCILRGLCTDIYIYDRETGARYNLGMTDARPHSNLPIPERGPSTNWSAAYTIRGHTQRVNATAFSPDGEILATGSNDGTVGLWSSQDGKVLRTLSGHNRSVHSLAFSPDGAILASGGDDGNVLLWQVDKGILRAVLGGTGNLIRSLAISPDGTHLAAGTINSVQLWQLAKGLLTRTLAFPGGYINALAFSPTGDWLAVSGGDGSAYLQMLSGDRQRIRLSGHQGRVFTLGFSPDGQILATGGEDGTVAIWKVRVDSDGQWQAEHQLSVRHSDWVHSLGLSPDGAKLVTGSFDSTVAIWDLDDYQLDTLLLDRPQNQVLSVAFSPRGDLLAGSTVRGEVYVWRKSER